MQLLFLFSKIYQDKDKIQQIRIFMANSLIHVELTYSFLIFRKLSFIDFQEEI